MKNKENKDLERELQRVNIEVKVFIFNLDTSINVSTK